MLQIIAASDDVTANNPNSIIEAPNVNKKKPYIAGMTDNTIVLQI
jgi:hypothetical protein